MCGVRSSIITYMHYGRAEVAEKVDLKSKSSPRDLQIVLKYSTKLNGEHWSTLAFPLKTEYIYLFQK